MHHIVCKYPKAQLQVSGYEGQVLSQGFNRDVFYLADEIFMTGTAAEVTPIREYDDRTIDDGGRGEITERLQTLYFDVVHGRNEEYMDWLSFID